jgi:hypothetical protein
MSCWDCGRELRPEDTSHNMRVSIANGLGRRLFCGDEKEEVYYAVMDWFNYHLTGFRQDQPQ